VRSLIFLQIFFPACIVIEFLLIWISTVMDNDEYVLINQM
jgi:hypothetical protein